MSTRFDIFENLAIDLLLRISFIDRNIPGTFLSEREIVQWHWRSVVIISAQMKPNVITANMKEVDMHMIADSGTPIGKHCLCCVGHKVTIPTYSPAAVLVICCGTGLLTVETHQNFVERRCSVTMRDLMDILPCKLF